MTGLGIAAILKAAGSADHASAGSLAYGMSALARCDTRLRVGGPWQGILPGVYLAQTGYLRRTQRDVAAFLFAECAIAVTGVVAAEAARHSVQAR